MNPQGEEGSNNQPPSAIPTAVVDAPLNPNPLDKLEGIIAAAKLEAAAEQTAPVQALEETPKGQFENQFGSGRATAPVTEVPSSSIAQLDSSIKTVDDLFTKGPQVVENPNPAVEAVAPAEKTPADILKERIAADIDTFLAEGTKDKIAA